MIKPYAIGNEVILFSTVPSTVAIDWCKQLPKFRFKALSSMIIPYKSRSSKQTEHVYQLTDLAISLIENSSEPSTIINIFGDNSLHPYSGWGSCADEMEKRIKMFDVLLKNNNNTIVESASKLIEDHKETVRKQREKEGTEKSTLEYGFEFDLYN